MELACIILGLLFLFTITALFGICDEYKKTLKTYKDNAEHHKYIEHHLQTMISLRDQRVSAQRSTIARLEADLTNCKYLLQKNETNAHN